MENNSNLPVENQKKSKKIWLLIGLAVLLVLGGFFSWQNYWSPEARSNRETEKNYQKYLDWERNYNEAMKNDVYGGKTPQETLDMFIAALRAGDTELASKYFVLKEDGKIDQKWADALRKTKEAGKIEETVNLLLRAKPDLDGITSNEDFKFSVKESGEIIVFVNLVLNKESKVWKIESL